jgi:hypothetical protein
MQTNDRAAQEQALFADLDLCDLGMALTKGAARRKFVKHKKACLAQLARWNKEDGLEELTLDEILAELAD